MLLNQNASMIRPLHWYPWVYISLVIATSLSLPELLDEPCIFNMTLQNFLPILSWELKNSSIVPTHYTLWYTIMSTPESMMLVAGCENVTKRHCNLTDWKSMQETYVIQLMGFEGNRVLINCMGDFFLAKYISFEPPDFDILGFKDHMKVLVKFPSYAARNIDVEMLQQYFSLVIEHQSEKMVKKHNPPIHGNLTGTLTYGIDKLIPNTNHCVSVYFEPKDLGQLIRPSLKCVLLPGQESESSESAQSGGIITAFLIAAFFISGIIILKQMGYICLKKYFPKTLSFYNWSAWIFPDPPALEVVDPVEVINVCQKKKVWNYTYDESDNEEEAALRTSAGGYTMHGLIGKPLTRASATSEELSLVGPGVDEPDLSEEEAGLLPVREPSPRQSQSANEPYQGRESLLRDPVSEGDSSPEEEPGGRVHFNVNLNSVLVRILDHDADIAPMLPYLPEETANPEDPSELESSFLIPREEETPPSSECQWSEEDLSEKSDTEESDPGFDGGYIMRLAQRYERGTD
ncbi:interferon alpha/beta receptor 2 isoform X2 [Echinops telfairi]|uniref:Interferon alpha/beta receptor 2 isoform X2 n=1 Tax=Echinops telfairi TaxID=9371 RepID=A0AC55CNU1_ECHTE|nr:interferon alpha/beta receptor 2 isoform X2 [Echinops telfairi]